MRGRGQRHGRRHRGTRRTERRRMHVRIEHCGERAPEDASALLARVNAAEWPAETGHAYLAGEAGVVALLRAALLERGFAAHSVDAKAYWGRGRANASHGEPLR